MEALGAAATIVQLISFTGEVLASGYGYLKKAKNAPSEIRSLLRETSILNTLLDHLQELVGEQNNSNAKSAVMALESFGIFEDCERLMKIVEEGIRFCERIKGQQFRNLGKRIAWPFKEKDTKDTMAQLGRLREVLSAAVAVDSALTLHNLEAVLGSIDHNVRETMQVITSLDGLVTIQSGLTDVKLTTSMGAEDISFMKSILSSKLEEEERIAIRRWLHPDGIDSEPSFKAALKVRHADTGQWLLASEIFQEWSNGKHHRCIWLYGIAGCGKTVLSATTIEYLLRSLDSSLFLVLYFFCDHQDPAKQSFQDLLHIIIKRLLDQSDQCFLDAEGWRGEKFPEPKSLAQPLTCPEYIELIHRLTTRWETVALVVDALDESNDLYAFLAGLESLMEGSNIKCCLTTRHNVELVKGDSLLSGYRLAVVDHMRDDIRLYLEGEVESRIARRVLKLRDLNLSSSIVEVLKEKADGMILIAKLQLEYICKFKSDRCIKDALARLPTDVYHTYDEILRQICSNKPEELEDLKKILQWLAYSMVPLTLEQVAEIVSIRPGDRKLDQSGIPTDLQDLVVSLRGLVVPHLQDTTGNVYRDLRGDHLVVITLTHYSVVEYLKSGEMDPDLRKLFPMDPASIHHDIARTCIQYVGFEDFVHPIGHPGSSYVYGIPEDSFNTRDDASNLTYSTQESQSTRHSPSRPDILGTQTSKPATPVLEIMNVPGMDLNRPTLYGQEEFMARKASPLKPNLHEERRLLRNRTSSYALYDYACRYWADHLRLSSCAKDPNTETIHLLSWFLGSSGNGWNYASWQQMYHRDIIYYCPDRPPLYYAIEFQIPSLVSLLLHEAINVNTLCGGVGALHVAARCGALNTVEHLLQQGAFVDLLSVSDPKKMTSMMTPLHFAAEGGHYEVMQLLLSQGANPNSRNESGSTPMFRAARSGSLRAMKVLRDAGANINAHKGGFTPLFEAVTQNRPRVACQLLHWGADPTILNEWNESTVSLLRAAALNRVPEVEMRGQADSEREVVVTGLKGDILGIIEEVRSSGVGPKGYEFLMKGLKRQYVLVKQMEKDTRPGTEREKDYRYAPDPSKIVTAADFRDREEDVDYFS